MSQNKTLPTRKSVELFLNGIVDDQKRQDSWVLFEMLREITGKAAQMWGNSIIGFDTYHYKYASGREGDWMLTGFSPRKKALSIYLMCDISHNSLDFESLGKHKKGKGCLYIKKLGDVHLPTLKKIIQQSIALTKEMYQ
ncbi:MAG: DUF1801 domain-containing protein [Flavobacteriaceae bacterium]|jgi:hypothetical protein|nr:DUF1801 domain-containing protein [Flavobacteriaceae bacterium]